MNCNEARRHWNLYHDSEGEAELHFQIGEHLAMCPQCAEWFHQQSRLEQLIVAQLNAPALTPGLWNRVLIGSGVRERVRLRHWLMGAVAACAATILLLIGIWYSLPQAEGHDLTGLGAAWHQRLVAGEAMVPFRSQSDLEVEQYLRQQVAFPVRCPPRKDAGFAVEGAGVCHLAEQPAAYLLGRVEESPVSIIILPSDTLPAFPRQQDAVGKSRIHQSRAGRYQVVWGVIDRNAVLIIGQVEPSRLLKVLQAYGTYPDHPAG